MTAQFSTRRARNGATPATAIDAGNAATPEQDNAPAPMVRSNRFDLRARALIVTLSISRFRETKKDTRATGAVKKEYGADDSAGNFTLNTVNPAALKEIKAIDDAIRKVFAHYSLPWNVDGARMVPSALFAEMKGKIADLESKRDSAVNDFIASWGDIVNERRAALGGLFDASLYDDVDSVRRKFRVRLGVNQVPDTEDFRLDLPGELIRDIEASARADMESVVADTIADTRARIAECVGHMAEKLAAYAPATEDSAATGIFKESLVKNVCQLSDMLPALNVSGNPDLDSIAKDIREKLTKYDAATLREDETARKETQEAAAQIMADMGAMFGA